MKISEEIRLIFSDIDSNHNKTWEGRLFENGDVETKWGRIGYSLDSKIFPNAGKSFLDKKKKEKIKKGYTELKTVSGGSNSSITHVQKSDLSQIAKSQIKTNKPDLQKLIDRLVLANIHTITHSTSIKYNDTTGLFSTPLGIVTPEGVSEARDFLVKIHKSIKKGDYSSKELIDSVNSYLRLIPQNLGMKRPDPKVLFADDTAIQQQNTVLDSLDASYLAMQTKPVSNYATKTTEEKVFDVTLELLEDGKEIDRINKFYRSSANGTHVSYRLKVIQIYKLQIGEMAAAFEKGKKCGNIKELWHGTKKANLLSILKCGLKVSPPSTAAIAGKMFGNGVYFSDQSTKSLNYAYGYWDGKYEKDCFMLLNDVAMGKEYIPRNSYESLPKPGYDSTFAIGGKSGVANNEMIVYNNNQINIKYLVEFKE